MEIQIIDTHNRDSPSTAQCGVLYDMAAPDEDASKPPGEWNRIQITCDGPNIWAELNGDTTIGVTIDDWDTPGRNPDGTENKFKNHAMGSYRGGRLGL